MINKNTKEEATTAPPAASRRAGTDPTTLDEILLKLD